MHNSELITDKTFFIMKDGDVKTYYKTQIINGTLQILVYDRESITGVSPLNTENLKTIITEYSTEYCEKLKTFIQFLYNALEAEKNPLLYEYIAHIWNGDEEKAGECYDEDCTLPEQFHSYMEELKNTCFMDQDVLAYFNVIHCEQEITYPRYCEKWLEDNYLVPKS